MERSLEDQVDPQTAAEINAAGKHVRDEALDKQAAYLFQVFSSFRDAGFSRRRSFTLTLMHYQSLIV